MQRLERLADLYAERHGGDEKEEAAYIAGYLQAQEDVIKFFSELVRTECPEARFPYLQHKLKHMSEDGLKTRGKKMEEMVAEARDRFGERLSTKRRVVTIEGRGMFIREIDESEM